MTSSHPKILLYNKILSKASPQLLLNQLISSLSYEQRIGPIMNLSFEADPSAYTRCGLPLVPVSSVLASPAERSAASFMASKLMLSSKS